MGCSQSLVEQFTYYHSGELLRFYEFRGKLCGLNTCYHKDGNLYDVYNYVNNEQIGPHVWFRNGIMFAHGFNHYNVLSEWKEYDNEKVH
jgi:antitoxin component YwqK of YwqJK toxin-antitoxin module